MVKAANILLAFLLALAPGMDAVRLLHVFDFCAFAGGGHAHLHAEAIHIEASYTPAHAHEHGQHSDKSAPEKDCPHLKNLSHGAPAMLLQGPLPFDLPAPPLAFAPQLLARPRASAVAPAHLVRPPPGPPRLGCVLLQV